MSKDHPNRIFTNLWPYAEGHPYKEPQVNETIKHGKKWEGASEYYLSEDAQSQTEEKPKPEFNPKRFSIAVIRGIIFYIVVILVLIDYAIFCQIFYH